MRVCECVRRKGERVGGGCTNASQHSPVDFSGVCLVTFYFDSLLLCTNIFSCDF